MSKFDKRIKPGVLIRAHRKGDNMHGYYSGQLVRVVAVYGDEVEAAGTGVMAHVRGKKFLGWPADHTRMFLYPGEYKYAKQANKKQGS